MANFFTYEERLTLQKLLKEGLSFKKIAAQLHKDPSTVSREVRKYSVEIPTGKPGYSFNACKNRFSCKIKPPVLCGKECTRKNSYGAYCRLCRCNEHCPDFVEEVCAVRVHVPYVCNACPTIDKCTLLKTFYDAEKAHMKSHQVISESRSGLSTSEEEVARLSRIITPLVKQGHAYPGEDGSMKLGIDVKDGMITLRFVDYGIPFDPLQKPDPDVTLDTESREIGGLGIFMVKKIMSDVQYERKDNQNILTLKKEIE